MTYLPGAHPVSRDIGAVLSVTVPPAVLAAVLTRVAKVVGADEDVAVAWRDLADEAAASEDADLCWDDREAYAEDAASTARELLAACCVDDGIELSWSEALAWLRDLVELVETAIRRRCPESGPVPTDGLYVAAGR